MVAYINYHIQLRIFFKLQYSILFGNNTNIV